MEITTRDYQHSNVIRVSGRVDASTYAELEAMLKDYIDKGRRRAGAGRRPDAHHEPLYPGRSPAPRNAAPELNL